MVEEAAAGHDDGQQECVGAVLIVTQSGLPNSRAKMCDPNCRSQHVRWVEPFAKPIAFIDENRWVSLRSAHPAICAISPPATAALTTEVYLSP
jgi:hypothetical protein